MRNLLVALFIAVLGGALAAGDAEARRLGSSRSVGAQRNVTPPPAAAKPAPQQAAPAQQAPAGNKWLPILGGLALGGMLGYLFGGNGLLGILLLALLAMVAVVGIRALMRRRREAPQPMQYAGMNERMTEAPPVEVAGVFPRSLGRHSYIRLTPEQFAAARDAITNPEQSASNSPTIPS